MISATELKLLRGWLVAIALFEVPNLNDYLLRNKPLSGFFSTLKNARPEKRCYSMVLVLLSLARIHAAFSPTRAALWHNAAVHAVEAVVFGREYLTFGSNGSRLIFSIIVANAVWFTACAARV